MALEPGDTIEHDGREILIQFVELTETGSRVLGRYIADDGSVDELADVIVPHVGHRAPFTGAWYCDTCDSPYCELA